MALDKLSIALLDICDELLLHIFAFLEIPELLACSRTCHRLRSLALDPVLHAHRLQTASHRLSLSLPNRPPLSSLRPPISAIYLTATHVAARKVRWSMLCIRLSRRLSRRPSASSLVSSNILPQECCTLDRGSGEVVWGGGVAPGIIGVKRKVERERLKDGLRAWVARRAEVVRGRVEREREKERERVSVRSLVLRFGGRRAGVGSGGGNWKEGKGVGVGVGEKRKRGEVTRSHVWGLRRFWEGIGREGQVG